MRRHGRRWSGLYGAMLLLGSTASAAGQTPVERGGGEAPAANDTPAAVAAAPAPLRVADLGWLAGGWRGTMGEAPIEEHWTAPDGGVMLGMFRWGMERELYELVLLEDTTEGVVLRLRHYGPALAAWETGTANDFRPVEHGPCWVLFAEVDDEVERTRLRYARDDDGDLVVHFIESRDGADRTMEFRFRPLTPATAAVGCA